MKRREMLKASGGAVAGLLFAGCIGPFSGDEDDEEAVGGSPYGTFRAVRDSEAREVEVIVEDPMTADHAAISGDHTFEADPVMEDIEEGSSFTLSAEEEEIEESGSLEIFAIRGDFETDEENGTAVLGEEPDDFESIDDPDNPFDYDFS